MSSIWSISARKIFVGNNTNNVEQILVFTLILGRGEKARSQKGRIWTYFLWGNHMLITNLYSLHTVKDIVCCHGKNTPLMLIIENKWFANVDQLVVQIRSHTLNLGLTFLVFSLGKKEKCRTLMNNYFDFSGHCRIVVCLISFLTHDSLSGLHSPPDITVSEITDVCQ